MILNQDLFNVESNCVPAGFIKFVVLHSFVIMIFAFANNVQIVLYLYSRRLERKKIFRGRYIVMSACTARHNSMGWMKTRSQCPEM